MTVLIAMFNPAFCWIRPALKAAVRLDDLTNGSSRAPALLCRSPTDWFPACRSRRRMSVRNARRNARPNSG